MAKCESPPLAWMYSSTPLNVLMPALSPVMYVVTVDDAAFGTLQYARWWLGDSSTRLLLRPSAAARRAACAEVTGEASRARRRPAPSSTIPEKDALEPDAYAATAPQHASAPIAASRAPRPETSPFPKGVTPEGAKRTRSLGLSPWSSGARSGASPEDASPAIAIRRGVSDSSA